MKKRGLAENHLVDWLYWSTHAWLTLLGERGGYGLFFSFGCKLVSSCYVYRQFATANAFIRESLQGVFSKFSLSLSNFSFRAVNDFLSNIKTACYQIHSGL